MGRYKTKRQAIEEANQRMIKEDTDEFKRQPGSMADTLWKAKHKEWEEEEMDNDSEEPDKFTIRDRDDVEEIYVNQSMAGPTFQKSLIIKTKSGGTYSVPVNE